MSLAVYGEDDLLFLLEEGQLNRFSGLSFLSGAISTEGGDWVLETWSWGPWQENGQGGGSAFPFLSSYIRRKHRKLMS